MITIYAKNGTAKCQARKLTLSEEFMGVAKMVVDIASPEPIDFAIDDYIDYSYNSRRYLLKDLAKVKKQARRNTYGEAFVYTCTFYEQTWELENCPFLDLVPAQQTAVYSSLPDVVVYAKPQNIVERVQANLDSFYGENEWDVHIPNYITDPTVLELLNTYKDITLNNVSCKAALDEIYKQWGLSWIFVTAYGRKQIYVAFAADISNLFKYGKGQGLRAITVEQKDTASLATRIYPYGSTENLPARWYNEHPLDAETKYIDEYQYIPNLMLPPSHWHGGTPDGNYVENAEAVAKYGLRPKAIYFEGGEYEKIMPSISGLTAKAIRDAKTEIGDTDNVPSTTLYPDSTRMDRVLAGDSLEDNGVSSVYEPYSESTTFSVPNPDEPTSTTIHLINEGVGGSTTRRMEEYTYESDLSLDLGTAQLSHIAQYRFTFSGISLTTSVPSELVGALDTLVITPTITGYLVNGGTGVDRFFVSSNPITLNATSGNFTNVVSLDSIIGSDEAIYKVFQAQSDALPSNLWLHLGFIIKYKFKAASSVTGGDVTLSINSGQGVCSRGVTQIANRFTVKLRQIGFDIMDCKKSANENRQLNMKSGLCAGYSFNILKTQYNSSDDSWTLTCYRTTDTDLKIAFPNADRHIVAEDEFVLTGIEMPDIYVYAAMEKLYEQALLTLAELSKPKLVYAPDIDNQKMAASPQVLHAGMLLQTEDTDLTLPALLPVDSLQITEDGEKLREFSVSLRNEKTDNLLRQIMTIAHTEQGGVSERQVSTAINQALNTYTSMQENEQGGSGSGNFGISFQPQGDGNAITEIVQSTPGLFYAKKEKTFVDLLSEQTVTGKKYLSSLLISALLAIPTVTPSPDSADANRSFLWCDTSGVYGEVPSGGGGGGGDTIYKLYVQYGSLTLTYDPATQDQTITVPTKVSDLSNDSGFLTSSTLPVASANTLGGVKIGANLTIDANGVLSAGNSYSLPIASSSVLGGIKVGTGLSIDANGVLSASADLSSAFLSRGDYGSAAAMPETDNTLYTTDNELSGSWKLPFSGSAGHLFQSFVGGSTAYMQFYAYYDTTKPLYWRASRNRDLKQDWREIYDNLNTYKIQRLCYATSASGEKAFSAGSAGQANGDYSVVLGGRGNIAGMRSGDTNKPYAVLAEYTPEAITYNGSTVYGIWNKYNDASSITFTYNSTSYTVSWPSGSPTYWRAMNIVKITGDIRVPSTSFPWQRYTFITDNGVSYGSNSIGQVTKLEDDLYAIISGSASSSATYPDTRPMLTSSTKIWLWTNSNTAGHAGMYASAIGMSYSIAATNQAIAMGNQSVANGTGSFAMGNNSFTLGSYAIAFGANAVAKGNYSIAFGQGSTTNAANSVALGSNSVASGTSSLAMGAESRASGGYSVAMGRLSEATNTGSVVMALQGRSGADYQVVFGKYNEASTALLVAGFGTSDSARANVMTLTTGGRLTIAENLYLKSVLLGTYSGSNVKMLELTSGGNLDVGGGLSGISKNLYLKSKSYIYWNLSGTTYSVLSSASLYPYTNEGLDLGSSSRYWKNIYAKTLTLSDTLAVTGISTFTGNLVPNADNATDIGTSSLKFKNMYLAGFMRVAGNIRPNSASDTNSIGQANYPFTNIYGKTVTASTALVSSGTLSVDGATTLGGALGVGGSITPSVSTADLGSASYPFRDLYLSRNIEMSAMSARIKAYSQDFGLYYYSENEDDYLPFVAWQSSHNVIEIGNNADVPDISLLGPTTAEELFATIVEVSGKLAIPTSAPISPTSGKSYLWCDTTGNYAELPNS